VIGTVTYDEARDSVFNSALLLDRSGTVAGRYDKVRLLAFGEYVPGIDLFPWLKSLIPAGAGHYTAGAGPTMMPLQLPGQPTWALGPLICYEDILPVYARQLGELHPNLLVNLTVDSWYGARAEPWEHLALAVFASIELRVALVRAVNSGISALIDPNGRLLRRTYADDPYRDPRPPDGIVVSAPRMAGGETFYVRHGNWFVYLCMAVTVLTLAAVLTIGPPSRAGREPHR
jgi:apolipoprotein N-acyltransferase